MMKDSSNNDMFLEESEEAGWIVTYSDLVTLLLVFFVLLYSISSLNTEKFKKVIQSIRVSLGEDRTAIGLLEIIEVPKTPDSEITIEELTGLKKTKDPILEDISQFITEKNMGDNIVLQILENKIIIRIRGKALFKSGSASLTKEAIPILNEIAKIIDEYSEYSANIKGHTDNVPISTAQFPSNWELSAVRATTVLKYLIKEGISPSRLTATGYGELLPLAPNTSEKNRARNRRVEFVLEKKAR